jgi:DNA invertase Pin-like site-specific DNA recombinase
MKSHMTPAEVAAKAVAAKRAETPQDRQKRRGEQLRKVEQVKAHVDKANAVLTDEIEKALAVGVTQEEVAKAAGISRVTLWRHNKRGGTAGTARPVTPSEVPDEAPPP